MRKISWLIASILVLISVVLYVFKSPVWYNFFVIPIWLIFDNLAHLQKRKTTLDLLINKNYNKFAILYLVYLFAGIAIELVGSLILKLWYYPKLWSLEPFWVFVTLNVIGYLFYPFILMSFREMYNFFNSLIKSNILDVILFIIVGVIIWEIPNVFSRDWIYTVPFIQLDILGVNVVVILGWIFLIVIPVFIHKTVDRLIK